MALVLLLTGLAELFGLVLMMPVALAAIVVLLGAAGLVGFVEPHDPTAPLERLTGPAVERHARRSRERRAVVPVALARRARQMRPVQPLRQAHQARQVRQVALPTPHRVAG